MKMKNSKWKGLLALVLGLASTSLDASVWWPEVKAVSPTLSIYQDYDDPNSFYYIPKSATTATHDETGKKMVGHGLFTNRLDPKNSVTQYHITLVPNLGGKDVEAALAELRKLHGSRARLSPLPITTVSFSVTQKHDEEAGYQMTAPFRVDVPNWTGNMHSFHQRFSVVMRGNMYMAEPAMSRFMTNRAGNAFVGTMHYGFRGVRRVFDGYMKLDVHQFVDSLKTHFSAKGFWSSVDIKVAIDRMIDEQHIILEVVKDKGYENEVWDALVQKLIQAAFQPAPEVPEQLQGGGGGKVFSFRAEYAAKTVDRLMTIRLREAERGDYSGDIDLTGGAMNPEQLDSRIRYLCDMWAKFDVSQDECVDVCEPMLEYYDPHSKTCKPAYGSF